jgi:hypothetical protein
MKQADSKARYLHNGLILGIVLGLGACGGLHDPSQETEVPSIGQKQGDLVNVKVAVGTGPSARSVSKDTVEFFANFYEVVFNKGTDFYRGEGTAAQGYVNVAVPVDSEYEVLVLAGYNRTLLAAGWLGLTQAVPGGTPAVDNRVTIKAGEANVLSIPVTRFPLQWDHTLTSAGVGPTATNDFEFVLDASGYTGSAPVVLKDRYINLAPVDPGGTYGPDQIDPAADKFTVTFNIAKLEPLINADINTTGPGTDRKLTLADHKVRLWPRYVNDVFSYIVLNPPATITNGIYPTDVPLSFVSAPTATADRLPKRNVDGILQFELFYYAFGTTDSKGTKWIIRNGLNRTDDTLTAAEAGGTTGTGPGSYFLVKIGSGTTTPGELVMVDCQ